jgi:hypothetical protein
VDVSLMLKPLSVIKQAQPFLVSATLMNRLVQHLKVIVHGCLVPVSDKELISTAISWTAMPMDAAHMKGAPSLKRSSSVSMKQTLCTIARLYVIRYTAQVTIQQPLFLKSIVRSTNHNKFVTANQIASTVWTDLSVCLLRTRRVVQQAHQPHPPLQSF